MSSTPQPAASHISVDSSSEMSFQSATSFESARSGNSTTERQLGGECWEAGNAPATAADPRGFVKLCSLDVCVFYYCRTYYKAVRVEGGGEWRTCAMRADEPRPVWMSLLITH